MAQSRRRRLRLPGRHVVDPELGIGIAVLTNSTDHNLQFKLSHQILSDFVNDPGSPYQERLQALPARAGAAYGGNLERPAFRALRDDLGAGDGARRWTGDALGRLRRPLVQRLDLGHHVALGGRPSRRRARRKPITSQSRVRSSG